jgi:hypothetical protein
MNNMIAAVKRHIVIQTKHPAKLIISGSVNCYMRMTNIKIIVVPMLNLEVLPYTIHTS